jgi:integrase
MASVTPRRNPSGTIIWRVQYRVDGRVRQDSFDTARAAREYAALVDRVGGGPAREVLLARDRDVADVPTLRQWVGEYLDPTRGHLGGITPGTREGYERIADRSFLTILGEIPLDSLTRQDIARWVHWREAQPSAARAGERVAAKTVKNEHALISAILAAAVEAGHIPGNVARGVRLTPGQRTEMVILTEPELTQLVDAMPAHYRPLTLFLAGTGMRWGEATALTWGDIDVRSALPTARVTKAWKINRITDAGTPAVDKRPRVHDLRHSHASWLIAQGLPLSYIQARLGHESIQTTVDRYGHLMPDAHQQLAAAAAAGMRIALAPRAPETIELGQLPS